MNFVQVHDKNLISFDQSTLIVAGLYLHIPFCKQACYYCDFHFSTNQNKRFEMVNAICKELVLQNDYLQRQPLQTIYYGGGTPSILSEKEIHFIKETIDSHYSQEDLMEITLEANPDDLSTDKLQQLRKAGINRLSIGIQSFDDATLTLLNRIHSSEVAIDTFEKARDEGFNNISIDLIYAIPGQGHDRWIKNVEQALALAPEHISAYSLTIEEKTVFGKWSATGKLGTVPDETAAHQMETLVTLLDKNGYEQYEISNFCKPGFQAVHNSNYWKQEHYLGVGPSAHSYNGLTRQNNVSNNHLYIKSITDGRLPFEREVLTREEKINEYLLTTLRTSWGCDLQKLKISFQYDLFELSSKYIEELIQNGLATLSGNNLRLTRRGMMVADKISSDLFTGS
jgi:oxygen-independent coproporphyrinogen-3 oxidase